ACRASSAWANARGLRAEKKASVRRVWRPYSLGSRLHSHLGRDRASVAERFDVVHRVAALELVEVAVEQRVAVEIEQGPFLGEQEAEVLIVVDLGDLAEELLLGFVRRALAAIAALLLEVGELPLGDAKGFVDRLVQVGMPIFPQQVLGLAADQALPAAVNAELDMDDRRNGAGEVLATLVDPHPAGDEAVVEPLEIGDPLPDLPFRLLRALDVVEGDLERHLQHRRLHIFGAFAGYCKNARPARIVAGV